MVDSTHTLQASFVTHINMAESPTVDLVFQLFQICRDPKVMMKLGDNMRAIY